MIRYAQDSKSVQKPSKGAKYLMMQRTAFLTTHRRCIPYW